MAQHKLPLFGPLDIPDYEIFLRESRIKFWKEYMDIGESPGKCSVSVDEFKVKKVLGKGTFGTVVLARYSRDRTLYAMKVMRKSHVIDCGQLVPTLREKKVLLALDCPFTVRMDMFAKDNSYLYFILPFIEGGELFDHLQREGKFVETTAMFYAAQVVLGLEYLHRLDLMYRDLKPENLLVDQHGDLKITDFGFTKLVESRTYTFCGTPVYMAPEVLTGHGYGHSADWWSLGVLIFEMMSGNPPHHDSSQTVVYKNILKNSYVMPSFFSASLQDLLTHLLETDVTRRYGNLKGRAKDIKRHPWFKPMPWFLMANRRLRQPFRPFKKPSDTPALQDLEIRGEGPQESQEKPLDLSVAEANEFEEEFRDF